MRDEGGASAVAIARHLPDSLGHALITSRRARSLLEAVVHASETLDARVLPCTATDGRLARTSSQLRLPSPARLKNEAVVPGPTSTHPDGAYAGGRVRAPNRWLGHAQLAGRQAVEELGDPLIEPGPRDKFREAV